MRNAEVGKDGAHGLSALDTYDVAAARAFIEKIPPRVIEEDSIRRIFLPRPSRSRGAVRAVISEEKHGPGAVA